ncbi:MAG: succinyl-diaminopimelate desuccinylase [Alphaproteobacteria bacterium]|nr:MAG: succinyl-diaminopimelate desuccinylase [Alphaproteobacteria bacterium]
MPPRDLPASKTEAAEDVTIKLAQALVRVPSVTPLDKKDYSAARQSIDVAAEAAKETGATITRLEFEGGHPKWDYKVENLVAEWSFGTAEKHICYIGHLDVVPPGDGKKWSGDPYSGKIEDGYLHGRGVTDMKGSVAAFISAIGEKLDDLKAQGNVKITVILTTDEEWAAVNGTDKVLKWMKARGDEPGAFIVGEPSSQDELGSHIKIGRRGSLVGTFNVKGVQGHAAYQDLFENPNRALALAISILGSHEWKDGNANFPNTNFELVALKSGDFNASAIIPGEAQALWNIRFTPQQTPNSLEKWIMDTLANPPEWAKNHPDADALKNITVTANKDTASIPYYSEPGSLAASAQDAVKTVLGTTTKLDGSGGTTDGRFASKIFPDAEIIELGLPERGGIVNGHKDDDYLSRGGMHQVDERAAVTDLINLRKIFEETVMNYDRKDSKPAKPGPKPAHPPHCG